MPHHRWARLCLRGLLALVLVAAPLAAVSTPVKAEPSGRTSDPTYRNPIREGAADPFVFTHDGSYYLTYTTVTGVVIATADSVVDLATATPQSIWSDSDPSRCCNVWAPEIHHINNRWYVYYTASPEGDLSKQRLYVLESEGDDPMGPYSFKAKLATQDDFSIDGTVLTMPDGDLYHVWSGHLDGSPQSLWIAPMSNPWTISGPPSLLSAPTEAWEQHEGLVNEGAIPLVRDGRVFIVYSGSQCKSPDYALGLLEYTGGSVTDQDSWTKTGPVFQRSDKNHVFGPGHNSLFASPDGSELWNAYHAVTSSDGTPYGSCGGDRSLRINKINFDESGTPDFGVPSASWTSLPLPSGDPGTAAVRPGRYRLSPGNNEANALAVDQCSTEVGAQVQVAAHSDDRCQAWEIRSAHDQPGTYSIINAHSKKPLTVADCSTGPGADVVQGETYSGTDCERWHIDPVADGAIRISSAAGGRTLDVQGCSTAAGAGVGTWDYWQGACQKWTLTKG